MWRLHRRLHHVQTRIAMLSDEIDYLYALEARLHRELFREHAVAPR
jgi:hypothetical protein